jgi:glycosyltransferase involved in cell wall biosynthesis
MKETTKPKVSIGLPNLNNRPFLEERMQTILDQTFTDWELIVVDSYSDDGAWEFFQEYSKKDARIRISQSPRQGIYAGFNDCIRLALGKYVYIATSDDTMMPDCLEKMVIALEAYPECDICDSQLKIIDEDSDEIIGMWEKLQPVKFYAELMDKPHIRLAPYDGILHCAFETVYLSITQLLIRRTVFDKVGLFRTDFGSKGDFEWRMRASLVCNTFHLPDTLATWRRHSQQSTPQSITQFFEYYEDLIGMVQAALPILKTDNPECHQKINLNNLLFIYRRLQYREASKQYNKRLEKLKFKFKFLLFHPIFFSKFISQKILNQEVNDFEFIRQELNSLSLSKNINLIE